MTTSTLRWRRRRGIGGLYAPISGDTVYYDIRPADPTGYDLSVFSAGRHRHLGRFTKQVEAKKAAAAMIAQE